MNPSIQRRLSLYLSLVILVAGIVAGGLSYVLAFRDATHSQDAQLIQVASALSRGSFKDAAPSRDAQEQASVDDFFVVGIGANADAKSELPAGVKLRADIGIGLQTIVDRGNAWRVVVTRDSNGERFGVVQSLEARAEDARDSARLTLIPIALLIPLLLVSVHMALKTLFSPLGQLSREVDGVTGASLVAITEDRVPREFVPFIQAVNRLLDRLGQAMAQQGRFVAVAAHEMRSPVAALMLQAENLEHCDLSADAGQRLVMLRRGLARMAALQDQLLRFARAQTPSLASPQLIDLSTVVLRALEELLPAARAKSIDVGCSRLEAVRVLGEMRHAESLTKNAIDNAIRYTPSGGSVDIELFQDGQLSTFIVEDTGPGIRQADIEAVFEPFVRVMGSGEAGSGLGLAIVRAAAEAMQGEVELLPRRDSRPGLCFRYRQAAV